MNEDRIAGAARNLGGKLEEGVGRVTGDVSAQAQGKAKQLAGDLQDMYGQAPDAATDAAAAVRATAADADDYIRRTIEDRPYTTALVCLAIGFVIGSLSRKAY